eukprot:5773612-Amphidinium_carterae.1
MSCGKEKLAQRGDNVQFEQLFATEIVAQKQKWTQRVVGANTCIFADVTELGNDASYCVQHKKHCTIPRVMGFVAGFSCKELSPANAKRNAAVLSDNSSGMGSTSSTWQGCLKFIHRHAPAYVIFENSDQLIEKAPEWDVVAKCLVQRGYSVHGCLVDSSTYGVPQSRRRSCIAATLNSSPWICRSPNWNVFDTHMQSLQKVPPCLTDCLLPDTHPEVCALEKAKLAASVSVSGAALDLHMRVCSAQQIRWSTLIRDHLSASTMRSAFFKCLSTREQEVLAYTQAMQKAADADEVDGEECLHRIQEYKKSWQLSDDSQSQTQEAAGRAMIIGTDVGQSIDRASRTRV